MLYVFEWFICLFCKIIQMTISLGTHKRQIFMVPLYQFRCYIWNLMSLVITLESRVIKGVPISAGKRIIHNWQSLYTAKLPKILFCKAVIFNVPIKSNSFWNSYCACNCTLRNYLHNTAKDHRKRTDKKDNLRWLESCLCLWYSVFIYSSFNCQAPTLCLAHISHF